MTLDPASLTVQWPMMLWALAALPLIAAFHLWHSVRAKRGVLRYAGLGSIEGATGRMARVRRFIPPTLMFLGLAALLFAIARPQASLVLPGRAENIILAMDVSGSMKATDIAPDRITAARSAARAFLEAQPRTARVGVVSIAASAAVAQAPTDNRENVLQAIDRFQLQRGTALGSGIIMSLATVVPEAAINPEKIISGKPPFPPGGIYPSYRLPADFKPVAPGSNGSAVIVLLSDGQSNMGPDPIAMATIAAEHGVRVYTVGIGTPEGTTLSAQGWSMRVRLDEEPLKKIAATTRADYFRASDAAGLKKIYSQLSSRLVLEKRQTMEITALFAGLGALLAMCAALLSLSWFNRLV
jgi:Ca-activated chloride channel family protein